MKPTYSVIGRSYIIPSLFSCWKKLHDTVMIFYTKLCPDKASASLSSNLVSIVSSTLILQACLASETVTWWLQTCAHYLLLKTFLLHTKYIIWNLNLFKFLAFIINTLFNKLKRVCLNMVKTPSKNIPILIFINFPIFTDADF